MEIQTITHKLFGDIRHFVKNGQYWFVGKDVAKALGYKNTTEAIAEHCKGGSEELLPSAGGLQQTKVIPESDLYRLIGQSKLEAADKFRDWIYEDVLPSIRRTGSYTIKPAVSDDHRRAIDFVKANIDGMSTAFDFCEYSADAKRAWVYGVVKEAEIANNVQLNFPVIASKDPALATLDIYNDRTKDGFAVEIAKATKVYNLGQFATYIRKIVKPKNSTIVSGDISKYLVASGYLTHNKPKNTIWRSGNGYNVTDSGKATHSLNYDDNGKLLGIIADHKSFVDDITDYFTKIEEVVTKASNAMLGIKE